MKETLILYNIMDTLEKQFQEAVDLDDIPGAVVTGRDATGTPYAAYPLLCQATPSIGRGGC